MNPERRYWLWPRDKVPDDAIFVFGSNLEGIHGAGAALEARLTYGAKMQFGKGPTGRAYALPTKINPWKKRSLIAVESSVNDFLDYAYGLPSVTFYVTRVGCGLAGFKDSQIAPLFKGATLNCVMPEEWRQYFS